MFRTKTNEEIWEELDSKEEHRTKAIDWVDAKIADQIAKGFNTGAARLQASKIQGTYRTLKNAPIKREINKNESPPCRIDEVEI
jgi:predicted nuclease with RNAse H fold